MNTRWIEENKRWSRNNLDKKSQYRCHLYEYWVVVNRYFSMCSVIIPNYDLSRVQQMKHMYFLFNKMQETLIYYIEKACTSRQ